MTGQERTMDERAAVLAKRLHEVWFLAHRDPDGYGYDDPRNYWHQIAAAALAEHEAEVARLRAALRERQIFREGGEAGCSECGHVWDEPGPESHGDGCLAAAVAAIVPQRTNADLVEVLTQIYGMLDEDGYSADDRVMRLIQRIADAKAR